MSALIVEAMIVTFLVPLNNMQPHIMNNFGNLLIFFQQSSLYVSFEWYLTKVPALLPWSLQILNSSMNITFI